MVRKARFKNLTKEGGLCDRATRTGEDPKGSGATGGLGTELNV